jgi:hypothetical protein
MEEIRQLQAAAKGVREAAMWLVRLAMERPEVRSQEGRRPRAAPSTQRKQQVLELTALRADLFFNVNVPQ